jgi:hypothetical protein
MKLNSERLSESPFDLTEIDSELVGFWILSIVQYSKSLKILEFLNTGRWTKSKSLLILSVIHHRQNPSEST